MFGKRIKTQVAAAMSAIVILIVIGTVVYHIFEKWAWNVSFYFTVVTLATVGYGDYYPTHTGTRIFTAFFILTGASIVVASLGIIGTRYLEIREQKILDKRKNK